MSNTWTVVDGILTQSADNLTWQIGVNPIVFTEPFADTDYTFQPDAPSDVVIHEVVGSRTVGGVQITIDAGTVEGKYIAIGKTNEYRQTSMATLGQGLIQTGKKALVAGRNTITFPQEFADTSYTFDPTSNATNITIDMPSATTTSIDVIAADDDPDFSWQAIGASL